MSFQRRTTRAESVHVVRRSGVEMQWDDLRYFLVIARRRSLAAAARDLGVSQATVWRHVSSLEQALQTRLFTSRSSSYVLSAAGEALFRSAERVEAEVNSARAVVEVEAVQLSGEVRVVTPEPVAGLLAMNLATLSREHPSIRVEMLTGSPTAGLNRRETDLALRFDRPAEDRFALKQKFLLGYGVFASDGYVRDHGRPQAVDRFQNHSLIAFDDATTHVAPASWLRKGGRGANIVFRSNSLQARLAVAKAGLGCLLLPTVVGLREPDLVQIFPEKLIGCLEMCLYSNARVTARPSVMAVSEFISQVLESHRDLLSSRA